MIPQLIELKDGLLADVDNVIMKARDPELFPENVKEYFQDKTKIPEKNVRRGHGNVTVEAGNRVLIFDSDMFDYISKLGANEYYISNIPIPWERTRLYPMFAKYSYGWVCLCPMEA